MNHQFIDATARLLNPNHEFHFRNLSEGRDWEWVFQFLADCKSAEVSDLLKLGGFDVSVNMLLRGNSPRRVWGNDGEIEEQHEPSLYMKDIISKGDS